MERMAEKETAVWEYRSAVLTGFGFDVQQPNAPFQEDGPGNDAWQQALRNQ